jgi:hypothetical protein
MEIIMFYIKSFLSHADASTKRRSGSTWEGSRLMFDAEGVPTVRRIEESNIGDPGFYPLFIVRG